MVDNKLKIASAAPITSNQLITLNVHEYLLAALANNTKTAYQGDIAHFLQWGGRIPATPECVASYLAMNASHLSVATLSCKALDAPMAVRNAKYCLY